MKRLLWRVDPRIWREITAQRRLVFAGLACSGGAAALLGLTAWLVKFTLAAIEQGRAERLAWLSLAVMGVFGLRYFFVRGQMLYLSIAATRLSADLRIRLFEKLQRLPVSYFNERRAGNIQSVLTNDVNVFQAAISGIRDGIDGPIKIVIGFITIIIMQWQLALVSVAIIPVMAVFIQRNAKKMRVAQADVQRDLGLLTATMQEQLHGTRIVKAFGAEKIVAGRFGSLVKLSYDSQIVAAKRMAILRPMVELIGALALAITVMVCGLLVRSGLLQVSGIGAFIYTLDAINQGFKNLGTLNQTMAQVQAATDRIYDEILDVPETISDEPGARTLPTVCGRVEFRNVSFAYPDGTQALKNVTFTIEPGTSLALVGPSGAGKSTIADLLLRFYDPSEGEILFDGVSIKELQAAWYRHLIGVVPQQTFLFAGPISENLRLAARDATDEQLRKALSAAHAKGFVEQMPEGMETELGERGVRLSGGEGQRIAIARALVREPKVLLLDEATSNLDAVSEKAVSEALNEVMRQRTSLFIAHRLTTAARADKIVVLRRGEVVEIGAHEELMAKGGAYASMYKAFMSGVLDDGVA